MITSAGRRASLVKSFKEEAKKISPESKILTAEANPEWSTAFRVSDGFFRLPRIKDKNYIESLLENCLQKNISVIIPTIDTELSILAESKGYSKIKILILLYRILNLSHLVGISEIRMFYLKN